MASNSVVTQEKLKDYHETLVYPYLNGATHTGCVPLGTIIPYYGETAPTYFLICDGTAYNKADYPELAAHLLSLTDTTPYVVSGDSTKFKVPDLRGEFLRGSGTNGHSGQGSGADVGVHQDGSRVQAPLSTSAVWNSTVESDRNFDILESTLSARQYVNKQYTDSSGKLGTIRPTNTSVLYCIAYRNAYIDLALDSFPINISNPTDGQLLMYDATAGRWVNGGCKYSTTEHVVGTWINGEPIYEKTIEGTGNSSVSLGSDIDLGISISGFMIQNDSSGINYMPIGFKDAGSSAIGAYFRKVSGTTSLNFAVSSAYTSLNYKVTVQYTKTTN